jgi:hypothetical protein
MYSYPNSNAEKKIALMIINDFFIQKAHELWIFCNSTRALTTMKQHSFGLDVI